MRFLRFAVSRITRRPHVKGNTETDGSNDRDLWQAVNRIGNVGLVWYRLFISVGAPFLLISLIWRILARGGCLHDLSQRIGGGTGNRGTIWLHGASNGELSSARALIEAVSHNCPGYSVIVTANTASGRDLVASWGISGVSARLAPLDLRWIISRFNRRWRPVMLISLENELWPNRIATARYPVFCVAARMSERSAKSWRHFPGLCRAVFEQVSWLFPQDDCSAERFIALGLAPERLGPVVNLKSGVKPPPPDTDALASLSKSFVRQSTVLAASTHSGEEEIVLDAFAIARTLNPDLRLIIAPRHPHRSGEVAKVVRAADLLYTVRSKSDLPETGAAVYIADTLGEMQLWYSLAGITFVGGSLVEKGGHTPYEPTHFGSAILHGPYVRNFMAAYSALDASCGALEVTDAKSLAEGIAELNQAAQVAQACRASTALAELDTADSDIQLVLDAVTQEVG